MNPDQVNLVVTDLLMPDMDGYQVLRAAKHKHAQTMVIILTGYADMEAAIDALRLGADDSLQKPCDIGELLFRTSNCFVKQDLKTAFCHRSAEWVSLTKGCANDDLLRWN